MHSTDFTSWGKWFTSLGKVPQVNGARALVFIYSSSEAYDSHHRVEGCHAILPVSSPRSL
jgi:hypothetical protein